MLGMLKYFVSLLRQLGCCGRASPHDYIVNDRMPPMTCFKNGDNTKSENLIGIGCRIMFENYWLDLLRAFNIIACVMIALEVGSNPYIHT